MQHALIIFIKNPVFGKVKTRLAATMGEEKALRVYEALLAHTRATAQATTCRRYLYYSDFVDEGDAWAPELFVKKVQEGADLGERMSRAFEAVLEENERAVIIGSDAPGITAGILEEAFQRLSDNDFVIGPTFDGGYYLLGMKRHEAAVFRNIDWSTPEVFAQTMAVIQGLGKTCYELQRLADIDYEEDWERWGE
jgi:uncharacterized protein